MSNSFSYAILIYHSKVMFSQSLSKGSEEAQIALQRLTTFLESEGSSGRISPALQKKVLGMRTYKIICKAYNATNNDYFLYFQMLYLLLCPTV